MVAHHRGPPERKQRLAFPTGYVLLVDALEPPDLAEHVPFAPVAPT